jgi:predicted  nucleic acid-binding Zn-ribbon protein
VKADPTDQRMLLDLAAEDVALAQLAHRRAGLPEEAAVTAAVEAERGLADDVVRAETEVRDLDREQKRLEADVDTVRQRAARDQQRMDSGGATPKEIAGLQSELASLARRQSDLEDQVLELMERREVADAALAAAQEGIEKARADRERAEQLRDDALADLADGTHRHEATRDEIARRVPEPLLSLYEKARKGAGGTTGAALLHARRCEGCRIELYGSELAAFRNAPADEVLRCDNCGRILVRTAESGL